ncbi:hypothetical protein [Arthrobacter sp. efr-133-TYG-104]|uniref:hypothetical protein n=1 Tax=Arthrobacter sp. efr-133-TYG-104 TaxID=3040324 RepID=UPI002549FAAB|nr:hypothetical protein [Arthrobacter sp. efr-133-TYG-104]
MAAEDYVVHTHASASIPEDTLTVWRPIIKDDLPCIQIDQSDGITAAVKYRTVDAVALAAAILEAAELDPQTAFTCTTSG